jgi:hypothetical protein
MLVIELGHDLEMASDTRLRVPNTHWRVPLSLTTGISLRVLGTGAGAQLLVKKVGGHPLQVPPNYPPYKWACSPRWAWLSCLEGIDWLGEQVVPANQEGHGLLSEVLACSLSWSGPTQLGLGLLTEEVTAHVVSRPPNQVTAC